ncbi:hypothetical protein DIZ27_33470 [Streptomyces sp. NWU339]|uniref:hypothetical protein n=1 Tax=Streptomyces sp. NWU339 TaxID=2185284 RepID=UPI000D6822A9|nr:hypothetical protein [Streptomyces sp. NWU339]PWI06408.1 hypothetical protein DIZ27_33470 [Streptomyces sp. NWU339]
MRYSKPLLRSGLTVAAAAALPLTLAGPAASGPGISVSTTGSTVSVTTTACAQLNGSWGTASLLDGSQSNFSQGRQVALSGTGSGQSAAWSDVRSGTHTVIVMCSNGTTAGTQSVVVADPAPRPAVSDPSPPTRGVLGGVGGGSTDYGTVTLVAGGALVGTGLLATVWYLRRRGKPNRL